jgi:hypothetical protein
VRRRNGGGGMARRSLGHEAAPSSVWLIPRLRPCSLSHPPCLCSAAKAGFVEKQAFLSRVDERRFDIEREGRARERARRDAEAAAAARR